MIDVACAARRQNRRQQFEGDFAIEPGIPRAMTSQYAHSPTFRRRKVPHVASICGKGVSR